MQKRQRVAELFGKAPGSYEHARGRRDIGRTEFRADPKLTERIAHSEASDGQHRHGRACGEAGEQSPQDHSSDRSRQA